MTELEYDITGQDGERRHLHARVAPVRDSTGRIVRSRGTAIDVTEADRAADARARRIARHAEYAKADSLLVGPIDLAALVAGVAGDYRGLAAQRVITADPPAGVSGLGSAAALDTVVRHLIENAIRFTAEDGRIDLVTRPVRGHRVELAIRDDGPGLPSDVDLFSAFAKGERSAGDGLGLHVVRTLVEAMGGEVTGHNREDGTGSEFIVTLPGAPDPQGAGT
ncbi:ATP-binding protein [Raineyella fluvialis]|uniref:ATP-binding protein n=1 Tax=Raineyella fluvialis TaxID=2662261 RepID=UPI001EEFF59B|nr:ATP-binding protein [Raineyella fluvialis]